MARNEFMIRSITLFLITAGRALGRHHGLCQRDLCHHDQCHATTTPRWTRPNLCLRAQRTATVLVWLPTHTVPETRVPSAPGKTSPTTGGCLRCSAWSRLRHTRGTDTADWHCFRRAARGRQTHTGSAARGASAPLGCAHVRLALAAPGVPRRQQS